MYIPFKILLFKQMVMFSSDYFCTKLFIIFYESVFVLNHYL